MKNNDLDNRVALDSVVTEAAVRAVEGFLRERVPEAFDFVQSRGWEIRVERGQKVAPPEPAKVREASKVEPEKARKTKPQKVSKTSKVEPKKVVALEDLRTLPGSKMGKFIKYLQKHTQLKDLTVVKMMEVLGFKTKMHVYAYCNDLKNRGVPLVRMVDAKLGTVYRLDYPGRNKSETYANQVISLLKTKGDMTRDQLAKAMGIIPVYVSNAVFDIRRRDSAHIETVKVVDAKTGKTSHVYRLIG